MKIRILISTLIVLAALAVPVTQISCASAERNTYRAVGVARVSADNAMAVWRSHVVAGKASVIQEAQVKLAYERYQLTGLTVIDAAKAVGANADKTVLNQAIAAASASLESLVNLIRSFGVKL